MEVAHRYWEHQRLNDGDSSSARMPAEAHPTSRLLETRSARMRPREDGAPEFVIRQIWGTVHDGETTRMRISSYWFGIRGGELGLVVEFFHS